MISCTYAPGVLYLGPVVAGLLGDLLAVLLGLSVSVLGPLGVAHVDVVGVAVLGVLDLGGLGVGLDVLLLVNVHADVKDLLLNLE